MLQINAYLESLTYPEICVYTWTYYARLIILNTTSNVYVLLLLCMYLFQVTSAMNIHILRWLFDKPSRYRDNDIYERTYQKHHTGPMAAKLYTPSITLGHERAI